MSRTQTGYLKLDRADHYLCSINITTLGVDSAEQRSLRIPRLSSPLVAFILLSQSRTITCTTRIAFRTVSLDASSRLPFLPHPSRLSFAGLLDSHPSSYLQPGRVHHLGACTHLNRDGRSLRTRHQQLRGGHARMADRFEQVLSTELAERWIQSAQGGGGPDGAERSEERR